MTKKEKLSTPEWFAILSIIIAMLTLCIVTSLRGPEIPQEIMAKEVASVQEIEVTVTGAVSNPGAHNIPKGSTIQDLLVVVQPLPEADLTHLILEKKLKNHQKIQIPKTTITVFLEGAVIQPGPLTLPTGSRLESLIDTIAFEDHADLKSLKKKRKLKDGETIFIKSILM